MIKLTKEEMEGLYKCPECGEETFTFYNHNHMVCETCKFKAVVKKPKDKLAENETELVIGEVSYRIKPLKEKDHDLVCVVENNEFICVHKHAIDYKKEPQRKEDDDDMICVVENNELICVHKHSEDV